MEQSCPKPPPGPHAGDVLTQASDHHRDGGSHARHVPVIAGPDHRVHVHLHHRQRPRRALPPGLGHHRVPHHLHGHHPAVRQAQRHLRPPPALPGRDRDLPGRLPVRRLGALHDRTGHRPRHPGHGRRRPAGPRADHHRRHRLPQGPGQVPGLLHVRLRHLLGARPRGGRRLRRFREHPGLRRLALGVLHQPAHRPGRAGRGVPLPAPARQAREAEDRLLGRGRHHPGHRAAAAGRRTGPQLGLDLARRPSSASAWASWASSRSCWPRSAPATTP